MKITKSFRHMISLIILSLVISTVFTVPRAVYAEEESGEETSEVTVDNGIPVVYLNIDESRGPIEDMIKSEDHSVYCYGTMSIDVPEGFHYSDFEDLACESFSDLDMSIRGRGNSTWKEEKKPFKIKLDKKADLFGLGKNKHWVLVANSMDHSLLKDRITAWLGDQMGFAFTPRGVPVDVVMTGESIGTQYLGSYYFSENVRVDDNRLAIAELEEDDVDPDIITGGYLLQNSLQVRDGSPDIFKTTRGAEWATHTPSFDTEENSVPSEEQEETFLGNELGDGYKNNAQQEYIQNYIQHAEDVLFEEGLAYRDVFDLESAAKYWLVNMFSMNADAYATGSTYIYKDRDPDEGVAKIFWGPLWDFDFAWNNNTITYGMNSGHLWMKPMFYDKGEDGFVEEVKKQWIPMREAVRQLIADGGVMDKYYEETKASAEYDHRKLHPDTEFNYQEKVEDLKTWISERLDWFDSHIDMVGELVHKVKYIVDDEVIAEYFMATTDKIDGREPHPEKEGYTFLGWADEEGNFIVNEQRVERDMTLTAVYVDEDELTYGEDIAFAKNCDVQKVNVHVRFYQINYEVIPTDAMNRDVVWTSSNEEFATVDETGLVEFSGTGEVVLTAHLKNGKTRDFTLTITEEDPQTAESMHPDEEVIELKVGQQHPFSVSTEPSPARLTNYIYFSGDPDVVTVGDLGVLTAVAPGETKGFVKANADNTEGRDIVLETNVTVIVTEDSEPEKDQTEMFRLYNPNSGEHFYTAKEEERDFLIEQGWNDEGIGWLAPKTSDVPVYRLYNANGGEHHYTMSAGEMYALVGYGWTYEGIGWYSDEAMGVTLYREYNPNMRSCNHNYTTNKGEHDFLVNIGWNDEGTAWYGVKAE